MMANYGFPSLNINDEILVLMNDYSWCIFSWENVQLCIGLFEMGLQNKWLNVYYPISTPEQVMLNYINTSNDKPLFKWISQKETVTTFKTEHLSHWSILTIKKLIKTLVINQNYLNSYFCLRKQQNNLLKFL